MAKRLPHIEVILPIYNEVNNIQPLLKEVGEVAARLKDEATLSYLFVNDGSSDGSRELLHRLFRDRSDIRVVDLLHNFGHTAAIACGIEHFSGDLALVMDADMQDPPEALIPMFNAWKAGAKTIVAERGERKEKTQLLFRSFYFLLHKVAKNLPPIDFGTHCLLDRSVVKRLQELKERNRYFPGLVSYVSGNITSIPVDRGSRLHGSSRVGFLGLIHLAVSAFLSFSTVPIRLVSFLGLICSASATLGGIVIVGIKLFTNKAIPGWASTMSLLFFGSGLQLLCLGMIGEYIARIYDEVKKRPLYLIDKVQEKAPRAAQVVA